MGSQELCNTLTSNGIEIECLKNNSELTKLYSLIMGNSEVYYKLISYIENSNARSKNNTRKLVVV